MDWSHNCCVICGAPAAPGSMPPRCWRCCEEIRRGGLNRERKRVEDNHEQGQAIGEGEL